ncbi:MAG: DinB family protein [Pseudomonadota bacterium]
MPRPRSAQRLFQDRGYQVGFCNTGCRDKFETAIIAFESEINGDANNFGQKEMFSLLAQYNCGLNRNVYAAAATLSKEQFEKDMGAFFGSIQITLNHILVWDVMWLKRMADHNASYSSLDPVRSMPAPIANDQLLYDQLDELDAARSKMDAVILEFVEQTKGDEYREHVHYSNKAGTKFVKTLGGLMQHMFNHQTHHRGQVSTLLFQQGIDPGVTDLLAYLPEETQL